MSACLAGVLSGLLGELACVGWCGRAAAPCRAPAVADLFAAGARLGASVGVDVWVLGRAGRAAVPAFALVPAGEEEEEEEEECSDFCASCLALRSDSATAACALLIARVSPSTPGAVPCTTGVLAPG